MLRQMLKYGTGLIALYLVVFNAEGARKVIAEGARGGIGTIKAFQGR
ncbi:hypothetical protein Q6348_08050 [Isoptericola sp. b441]|uniref:Uncharacterized protein n=1 Tax=Actinotalea lenta TaxID=3064654 RepID=A0ABT9D8D8_9CELL|nr:hypothetical protein [Isoptericola sp. b441]MDO8107147.1 hypothetical protein [Isoptericola sp. b441]